MPACLPCCWQEDVILVEASDEEEDEFDLEGDGFVDFDADDDVILSDDEDADFEGEEDGAWHGMQAHRLGSSWRWCCVGCRDRAVACWVQL